MLTDFELGFLVGILARSAHFGGDNQPKVTLRLHVRNEQIFQRLLEVFPGSRLYGPYHHGGRDYRIWAAYGRCLRDELVPLLDRHLSPDLDRYNWGRYELMKANYPQLAA